MHKHVLAVTVMLLVAAVISGCSGYNYTSYEIDCVRFGMYGIDKTVGTFDQLNYDTNGDSIADAQQVWVYAVDSDGKVVFDGPQLVVAQGASYPAVTTGVWTYRPAIGTITVEVTLKANGFLTSDYQVDTFVGKCKLGVLRGFADGRINRFDAGAPVAVYPVSYGARGMGLHIYAIQDDSTGELIMQVTPEQLAAASGEWALVAANDANTVQVFKYLDQWQINAQAEQGKVYVLIFENLYTQTRVDSYTTDPVP